jgi:hypothetical protein
MKNIKSMKNKSRYVLPVLSSMLLSGCSVFGVSTVEEAKYQIVQQDGEYSIRHYDPVMMAEVSIKKESYDKSTSKAFGFLFNYISGANQSKQKISMTAPVLKKPKESEKIAMTAPVFIDQNKTDNWSMSFVLPASFTPENTPSATNPEVHIHLRSAETFAVVQFSGTLSEANRQKYTNLLEAWIQEKGYKQAGLPVFAGYNPPWTIPAFRRNEVQILVNPLEIGC